MIRRMHVAGLVLAALAITSLAGSAAAGEFVPFKGTLEGDDQVIAPPPLALIDSVGEGQATVLGRFTYQLLATVDFTSLPPQGEGRLMLTAANGDTLFAETEGFSVPIIPGVLVLVMEEAVIVGGTGRFEGAGGSFTIERLVDQDTRLTIGSFEGTITNPGNN
jgi:hypothetical protein